MADIEKIKDGLRLCALADCDSCGYHAQCFDPDNELSVPMINDALSGIVQLEKTINDKDAEISSLKVQLAEALAVRGW